MASKATRRGVLRRYLLFQIPELLAGGIVLLLLVRLDFLSIAFGWILFAGWLLKEAALYPLVRRAYEPSSPMGGEAMVGATGFVAVPASAASDSRSSAGDHRSGWQGRVQIGPELWNARLAPGSESVSLGSQVRVEAVEGLTLIVSAIEPARR